MTPNPGTADEYLWVDPPLIGLYSQLGKLAGLLAGGSALGVVRGELGPERVSLLVHFSRLAKKRGWRIIFLSSFRPDGSREALVRELRQQLNVLEDGPGDVDKDHAELLLGKPVKNRFEAAEDQANALAETLALHPTLLIGDNYDASAEVEGWLLDEFIPQAREARVQTVVLIAGRPDRLAEVTAPVAVAVDAGPPTQEQVRQHLEALGRTLATSFSEAELDSLSAEAASAPNLVPPLIRVLAQEPRRSAEQ